MLLPTSIQKSSSALSCILTNNQSKRQNHICCDWIQSNVGRCIYKLWFLLSLSPWDLNLLCNWPLITFRKFEKVTQSTKRLDNLTSDSDSTTFTVNIHWRHWKIVMAFVFLRQYSVKKSNLGYIIFIFHKWSLMNWDDWVIRTINASADML